MNDLRTPENVALLKKLPKSKLAYYIKTVTRLPSGDRNNPNILDKPFYSLMRRPVDPRGNRSSFYGEKVERINDYNDKDFAEAIAFTKNFYFHEHYLRSI